MVSLGLPMHSIMSSAMTILLLLFLFRLISFFLSFFFWSCCHGQDFQSYFAKKSGESGHPCLAPNLRGEDFSFSQLRMVLAVGLSYMAFITLR